MSSTYKFTTQSFTLFRDLAVASTIVQMARIFMGRLLLQRILIKSPGYSHVNN